MPCDALFYSLSKNYVILFIVEWNATRADDWKGQSTSVYCRLRTITERNQFILHRSWTPFDSGKHSYLNWAKFKVNSFVQIYFQLPSDYTIVEAFDVFFKLHFILGLSFDKALENIIIFIQRLIYKLRKGKSSTPIMQSYIEKLMWISHCCLTGSKKFSALLECVI